MNPPTHMSKTLKSGLLAVLAIVAAGQTGISAQTIDYSVVSVPEESGLELTKITNKGDYVCLPQVVRRGQEINWFSNRVLAPLPKSEEIAYLSFRNNATNIFIKDLLKQGGSRQRTNRTGVIDFSFSSDGKDLYFAETRGNTTFGIPHRCQKRLCVPTDYLRRKRLLPDCRPTGQTGILHAHRKQRLRHMELQPRRQFPGQLLTGA